MGWAGTGVLTDGDGDGDGDGLAVPEAGCAVLAVSVADGMAVAPAVVRAGFAAPDELVVVLLGVDLLVERVVVLGGLGVTDGLGSGALAGGGAEAGGTPGPNDQPSTLPGAGS